MNILKKMTFVWHKQFKKGQKDMHNDTWREQPKKKKKTQQRTDANIDLEVLKGFYKNLLARKDLNPGLTRGFFTMTVFLCMMHLEFTSSWLRSSFTKIDHLPYSSDLATHDFLKNAMKKKIIADIKQHTTTLLKVILKNKFQECFQQW